jgi:hypothetical protein
MSLTEEDKQWIKDQMEAMETKILTAFHKWASPVDMRQRSHAATLRALDVEMESLSDRVKQLEEPK